MSTQPTPETVKRFRFFVLEDEIFKEPRKAITAIIKNAGHTCTLACNSFMGVENYPEYGPYDYLLLDHDMHGHYEEPEAEDTGYQFVKWLAYFHSKVNLPKPHVIIHTQNPKGERAMVAKLVENGFEVEAMPFSAAYLDMMKKRFPAIYPTPKTSSLVW